MRVASGRGAQDPYFLYAASNLGSLAGLLAYPILIEPVWTLPQQAELWPKGAYISGHIVDIMQVTRGKIVSHRIYWDMMGFLGQLGVGPS